MEGVAMTDSDARGKKAQSSLNAYQGNAFCSRSLWRRAVYRVMCLRHETILKKDPNRPWRQRRYAHLLYHLNDYQRAAHRYEVAISLHNSDTKPALSLVWRRLSQCYLHIWKETANWEALWKARRALEATLQHVEYLADASVLYEYEYVLETIGALASAYEVCCYLQTEFPTSSLYCQFIFRAVSIQFFFAMCQKNLNGEAGEVRILNTLNDQMRLSLLDECIEMTARLLSDHGFTSIPTYYTLILYLRARSFESKAEIAGSDASHDMKQSTDRCYYELFLHFRNVFGSSYLIDTKKEELSTKSFVKWADLFSSSSYDAPIFVIDALLHALELNLYGKENLTAVKTLASTYHRMNQMEFAIRAMECCYFISPYNNETRENLKAWFPTKWQPQFDREDASQNEIARMVRGMLVRDKLARCKRRRQEEAEVSYFANPYDKAARLHLVQVYGSKYGVRLAAEEASAYRIQKWIRKSNLRAKISHLVYKWQYDNSHKMEIKICCQNIVRYEDTSRRNAAVLCLQRWFKSKRLISSLSERIADRKRRNVAEILLQPDPEIRNEAQHAIHSTGIAPSCLITLVEPVLRTLLEAIAHEPLIDIEALRSASCIQRLFRRYAKSRNDGLLACGMSKADATRFDSNYTPDAILDRSARTIQSFFHQLKRELDRVKPISYPSPIDSLVGDQTERFGPSLIVQSRFPFDDKSRLFRYKTIIVKECNCCILYTLIAVIRYSHTLHCVVIDGGHISISHFYSILCAIQNNKKQSFKQLAIRASFFSNHTSSTCSCDSSDNNQGQRYGHNVDSISSVIQKLRGLRSSLDTLFLQVDTIHSIEILHATEIALKLFANHLRYISLLKVQLADPHIQMLKEALKSNSLQYIDLHGNQIGDRGAELLAQGIQKTENLLVLNVSDNQISSSGARALLNCAKGTSLRLLLLCNNRIQRTIMPLMQSVSQLHHIVWIDVRGNRIPSCDLQRIMSRFYIRLNRYCAPIGPIHDIIQQLKQSFLISDDSNGIASEIGLCENSQNTSNVEPKAMTPKQWIRCHKLARVVQVRYKSDSKEAEIEQSCIQWPHIARKRFPRRVRIEKAI